MTVNTVNNKIYMGIHITEDPTKFDNYWGCGITGTSSYHFKHPKTPFQRACKKYGLAAFKRYTLFIYNTYEEAQEMEKILVNDSFVARADTYNTAIGGGEGRVPKMEIEVHKYDLEGNYIETYISRSDAARKNGVKYPSILSAIINKGICAGFYWSETKVAKLDISGYKKNRKKEVFLYDKNGDFLQSFESAAECAKFLEVRSQDVSNAARKEIKCFGYYILYNKYEKFSVPEYKRNTHHKVYQYDKDGKFIAEFSELQNARNILKLKLKNCAHKIQTKSLCDGFYWAYEKYSTFPIKKKVTRKVIQKDLGGNIIKVWDKVQDCKKEFANVRYVLSGARPQTKGYKFEYYK